MSETTERPARRRAKIRLSLATLERFIDLPEGLVLSHLYASNDPDGVILVVEGDSLDEVEPDRELPYLDGMSGVHWESATAETGGRPFHRFFWRDRSDSDDQGAGAGTGVRP